MAGTWPHGPVGCAKAVQLSATALVKWLQVFDFASCAFPVVNMPLPGVLVSLLGTQKQCLGGVHSRPETEAIARVLSFSEHRS